MTTGYSRGYILDAETLESIPFDFFEAPNRSGGSASWEETTIRLRSTPHQTYVDTSAVTYNITGKIVASVEQGDYRTGAEVKKDIRFLSSFQYPEYVGDSGLVKPPHRVRIWLKGVLNAIGLLKNLNVEFPDETDVGGNPLHASVTFDFVLTHDFPPSYEKIREGSVEI